MLWVCVSLFWYSVHLRECVSGQWALDAMRSPELWNDSNIMQYENQIIPIQRVVGADIGVPIAKMVEIIDREKKKGLKVGK